MPYGFSDVLVTLRTMPRLRGPSGVGAGDLPGTRQADAESGQ